MRTREAIVAVSLIAVGLCGVALSLGGGISAAPIGMMVVGTIGVILLVALVVS